jgi:hypothetical protein
MKVKRGESELQPRMAFADVVQRNSTTGQNRVLDFIAFVTD